MVELDFIRLKILHSLWFAAEEKAEILGLKKTRPQLQGGITAASRPPFQVIQHATTISLPLCLQFSLMRRHDAMVHSRDIANPGRGLLALHGVRDTLKIP
jgi:hypothetical protein